MSKAQRRAQYDLDAHAFAERHRGPLAALLVEVEAELREEIGDLGLTNSEADRRLALEMSYRLDRATDWMEIIPAGRVGTLVGVVLEALDGPGYFLAASAVIGIWRRLQRRQPILRARIEKLAGLIEHDDTLPRRRKRLERRLRRLEARAG